MTVAEAGAAEGGEQMNDIGYKNLPFIGSELEITIMTAKIEHIENILVASKNAVSFHKREQNPKAQQFFQSAVDLCKKRMPKSKLREGEK